MNLDPMKEEYIPGADSVVIGRFGRAASGGLRVHCGACLEAHPVAGYDGRPEADPMFGDLGTDRDMFPDDTVCDVCDRPLADISREINTAHRAQQDRWARAARPAYVIEYGICSEIRCRVY